MIDLRAHRVPLGEGRLNGGLGANLGTAPASVDSWLRATTLGPPPTLDVETASSRVLGCPQVGGKAPTEGRQALHKLHVVSPGALEQA